MSDAAGVVRFYGRWAGLYDLLAARAPGIGRVRERTAAALGLEAGDTVLEMGCGTGANLPYLRECVGPSGRVVGVDLTPGMLEWARRRVEHHGWGNVDLVLGDATGPPVSRADAVLASFVVGMFEQPGGAVDAWSDVVGPGGRLALLDAAPRGGSGPLDAAFGVFVALGAPPTWRLRYEESPARRLGERIGDARDALRANGPVVVDDRYGRGFLQLTAGRVGDA